MTPREFSRFNRIVDRSLGRSELPEGGLCLSAFLVITEPGRTDRVLMGHLNPAAPWDRLGALNAARVERHRHGWMLPSSHLMIHESPEAAAHRIATEQLELPGLKLDGPRVVSEVYVPQRYLPNEADWVAHWDFEFIFRGELAATDVPKPAAWTDLAFVDLRRTSTSDVARSHEDIIESAGLRFGGD
jgi:hypothetical protein